METLIKVGCLFIFSLALFHTLLLSQRIRRSGIFWHVVDYLWLTTAAVALAFASVEVQRSRLNSLADEKRTDARVELNRVRMHASHIWEILQGERDKDGGRKGIDWFKKVSDELEMGLDGFRWEIFVSQNYDDLIRKREFPEDRTRYVLNPTWADYKFDLESANPTLMKEATLVVRELNDVSNEKNEIYKIETELKSTETEKGIKFTWPWILCLALSLRITKVTADLLKYKESAAITCNTEDRRQTASTVESDAP